MKNLLNLMVVEENSFGPGGKFLWLWRKIPLGTFYENSTKILPALLNYKFLVVSILYVKKKKLK
jgi:hypothetical protein